MIEPEVTEQDGADAETLVGEARRGVDGAAYEGRTVGRYVVLERIGGGGMGEVLRAYDPKLRREVALKVMRAGADFRGGEAEARMLREAQALARLRSAHVVAVYDAEVTDLGVCIAMEYVEGRTLRAWLDEATRPWSEVLEVVLAAARGLAAAHAAGLVHRDVKPDNVLVGAEDRVWLTDFGLAREPAEQSASIDEPASIEVIDSLADLTRAGTLLGTPPYVAPEQHAGGRADARSDQYALCVMLWEALYGARPFVERDWDALAQAKRRGPPSQPSASVPGWVHEAVARGLAVDPDARWPSVDGLVSALASGPARARRRRAIAAAATLGIAVVGVIAWTNWDRRQRVKACEREGEAIAEVWNEDAANALRSALVSTGVSYAAETADLAIPRFEESARAWADARAQACVRADVEAVWDADLLDRSVWCFDEHRLRLAALLTELGNGERRNVVRAVQAAISLGDVDACLDAVLLQRLPAPPTTNRDAIAATRAKLSRANALQSMGAFDEGLAVAEEALADAEAIDWPPLRATARLRVGSLAADTGELAEAEAALEEAYFEAGRAGAWEVAVDAAEVLVGVVGNHDKRPAEGERWAKHAAMMAAVLPDPTGLLEADHANNLGTIREVAARYEEAATLHERAIELREAALGPHHPDVASSLNNLAVVRSALGSHDEAASLLERAIAIHQEAFGPHHPDVATVLNNLGAAREATNAFEEARQLYERAMKIYEDANGPDHPDVAMCMGNIASVLRIEGKNDEAARMFLRSIAIYEAKLGPNHVKIGHTLLNFAILRKEEGANAEAAAMYARALAILEPELGPDHPDVAHVLNNSGGLQASMGEYGEAARLHERALAIYEATLGPDHTDVAMSLGNLADARRGLGEYEEASKLLLRSLAIYEAARGADHPDVAYTLGKLAAVREATGAWDEAATLYERAVPLWETGLDPDHPYVALPLVGLARVALAQDRPADAVAFAERAVKLREHETAGEADRAEARFLLARALVAAGGSEARAVALASEAREVYAQPGPGHATLLAGVDAFLREHRSR